MWLLLVGAIVVLSFTHWLYSWRNPKCNGKLPPGSMGFPLLGETLQFFAPNTSSDIPPFIRKRMDRCLLQVCFVHSCLFFFFPHEFWWKVLCHFRYGPIFRTSLVGRPLIVSTDPELNYLIFQQEGQLFQSWYPDTFTEIFGRQNVGSLHGFMYKYLKNMVLHLFGPESLRKMIPEVEAVAARKLRQWSSQSSVELKDNTASVITY